MRRHSRAWWEEVFRAGTAGDLPDWAVVEWYAQDRPRFTMPCSRRKFREDHPQLRFATEEEAEAARKRLAKQLPTSEPVWAITKEIGPGKDWAQHGWQQAAWGCKGPCNQMTTSQYRM